MTAKRGPAAPSPGGVPRDRAPSPPVKALGRTLATDRVTAEVSSAFHAAGIRSILLKGPALARWLYDDGALRTYMDCDLLVSPEAFSGAERILKELGFQREGLDTIPHDWPKHARTWYREGGGNVDLHRSLVGVGVPDVELWQVLSAETETMQVGGATVEVLSLPGRALVVALHAAKDGSRTGKVRHDLGHALERVETDVWREASRLAARLGALPTFAAGLRLLPPGQQLARELDLPTEVPMEAALRSHGGAPPFAVGIDWLARAPGFKGKLALVGRKLVPPPAFMRSWKPLARGGPLGLAAAYVWRPFWVAWRRVPALAARRRAPRETSRSRSPRETGP